MIMMFAEFGFQSGNYVHWLRGKGSSVSFQMDCMCIIE